MDSCYCDWGGNGGHCISDCCKCDPCCGTPCNFIDGLYCCLCWYCCAMCSYSKLYASSLDRPCYFLDDCLVICCASYLGVFCIFNSISRSNLRIKYGIGKPQWEVGDFCMTLPLACCACPCELCQECRSVPKGDWDWLKQITDGDGCLFMGDFQYCRQASANGSSPHVHVDSGPKVVYEKDAENIPLTAA